MYFYAFFISVYANIPTRNSPNTGNLPDDARKIVEKEYPQYIYCFVFCVAVVVGSVALWNTLKLRQSKSDRHMEFCTTILKDISHPLTDLNSVEISTIYGVPIDLIVSVLLLLYGVSLFEKS